MKIEETYQLEGNRDNRLGDGAKYYARTRLAHQVGNLIAERERAMSVSRSEYVRQNNYPDPLITYKTTVYILNEEQFGEITKTLVDITQNHPELKSKLDYVLEKIASKF